MSKINFEDKSYIEIKKSSDPGKIMIIIQAQSADSAKKKITNCVEITKEQFDTLISDIK